MKSQNNFSEKYAKIFDNYVYKIKISFNTNNNLIYSIQYKIKDK